MQTLKVEPPVLYFGFSRFSGQVWINDKEEKDIITSSFGDSSNCYWFCHGRIKLQSAKTVIVTLVFQNIWARRLLNSSFSSFSHFIGSGAQRKDKTREIENRTKDGASLEEICFPLVKGCVSVLFPSELSNWLQAAFKKRANWGKWWNEYATVNPELNNGAKAITFVMLRSYLHMCRTCGPCIWEPGTSYELDEIKLILASRVSPAKSGETIERRMLSNIHLAKKTNYANGGHRTIF